MSRSIGGKNSLNRWKGGVLFWRQEVGGGPFKSILFSLKEEVRSFLEGEVGRSEICGGLKRLL